MKKARCNHKAYSLINRNMCACKSCGAIGNRNQKMDRWEWGPPNQISVPAARHGKSKTYRPVIISKDRKILRRFDWCQIERGVSPPLVKDYNTLAIVECLEIGDCIVTTQLASIDRLRTSMRRVWGPGSYLSRQDPNGEWRLWRVK